MVWYGGYDVGGCVWVCVVCVGECGGGRCAGGVGEGVCVWCIRGCGVGCGEGEEVGRVGGCVVWVVSVGVGRYG